SHSLLHQLQFISEKHIAILGASQDRTSPRCAGQRLQRRRFRSERRDSPRRPCRAANKEPGPECGPEDQALVITTQARITRERLQAGGERTEHGLIFPTAFGNPSDPNTFSHLLSKLARKAARTLASI